MSKPLRIEMTLTIDPEDRENLRQVVGEMEAALPAHHWEALQLLAAEIVAQDERLVIRATVPHA